MVMMKPPLWPPDQWGNSMNPASMFQPMEPQQERQAILMQALSQMAGLPLSALQQLQGVGRFSDWPPEGWQGQAPAAPMGLPGGPEEAMQEVDQADVARRVFEGTGVRAPNVPEPESMPIPKPTGDSMADLANAVRYQQEAVGRGFGAEGAGEAWAGGEQAAAAARAAESVTTANKAFDAKVADIDRRAREVYDEAKALGETDFEANRWFKSASTGKKILMAVTTALAGFGGGVSGKGGGAGPILDYINQAAQRDLNEQIAEYNAKEGSIKARGTLLQQEMSRGADEHTVRMSASLTGLSIAEKAIEGYKKKYTQAQVIARGDALKGEIEQKRIETIEQWRQERLALAMSGGGGGGGGETDGTGATGVGEPGRAPASWLTGQVEKAMGGVSLPGPKKYATLDDWYQDQFVELYNSYQKRGIKTPAQEQIAKQIDTKLRVILESGQPPPWGEQEEAPTEAPWFTGQVENAMGTSLSKQAQEQKEPVARGPHASPDAFLKYRRETGIQGGVEEETNLKNMISGLAMIDRTINKAKQLRAKHGESVVTEIGPGMAGVGGAALGGAMGSVGGPAGAAIGLGIGGYAGREAGKALKTKESRDYQQIQAEFMGAIRGMEPGMGAMGNDVILYSGQRLGEIGALGSDADAYKRLEEARASVRYAVEQRLRALGYRGPMPKPEVWVAPKPKAGDRSFTEWLSRGGYGAKDPNPGPWD